MCHLTCGERVRWHAFSKGYSYMKNPTVDVIIPTYKPDPSFRTVLERLSDQYYAPRSGRKSLTMRRRGTWARTYRTPMSLSL